jgi:hypothetical protein
VIIGKDGTVRGQVLARKVRVGKNFIVSRNEMFEKESDISKLVEAGGVKYISNEVIILMSDTATFDDMLPIAKSVNGKIVGFLDILKMVKIEIPATTYAELNRAISSIGAMNSPFVEGVLPNFNFE